MAAFSLAASTAQPSSLCASASAAATSRAMVAFYQAGYGVAAFGVGPLREFAGLPFRTIARACVLRTNFINQLLGVKEGALKFNAIQVAPWIGGLIAGRSPAVPFSMSVLFDSIHLDRVESTMSRFKAGVVR